MNRITPFHLQNPEVFTAELLAIFAESSNQKKRLVAARHKRTPYDSLKELCKDISLEVALATVANPNTTFDIVVDVWVSMPEPAAWSFLWKPEKNLTVSQYAELYAKRDSPFVAQRTYNSEPEKKALTFLLGLKPEETSGVPLEWLVSLYKEIK